MDSETLIETFEHKGYTIEKHIDDMPNNPRKIDDNLGTIAYSHRREYVLGEEKIGDPIEWLCDKLELEHPSVKDNEKLEELENEFLETFHALPVYMYEHSGATISTSPFICGWDSGKVGYIYVTKKEMEDKNVSEENVEKILQAEIDAFDKYIKGEIFGYIAKSPEGQNIDSLWGVDDESLEEETFKEMKEAIDQEIGQREEFVNMH